jgi:2-methylcitrate dehydratase PrpD
MSDPARDLARFALDVEYEQLPDSVQAHVGLVVADTVGAMIGGNTLPEVSTLAEIEAAQNPGGAAMLGTNHTASPGHAAMVNGTGGTSLELDEGHKYAAGHPAIHVLPAVLAEGEVTEASGEAVVEALVAGYEVGTRVGRACIPLDETYHMHGLWGTVGTAAGVARLRELDFETTVEALRMAANHALHTRFEAALEGATVRNTYAGQSNLSGLSVANQAEAGFTGLENGIERHLSRVSDGFDPADLTDRLGELWEVERGYFKRHAACRYTHPTLDALESIAAERSLDRDEIESVRVETYETAAKLRPARPTNPLQAKFSIPFAVATYLVHGHSGKAAFTAEALTDEAYALADRVTVVEAEDLNARVPDERGARVRVTLTSGETLEAEVPQAQGGADRPFTEADIREKYDWLVEPTLGPDRTDELWTAARQPTSVSPAELCALTTPA